MQPVLCDGCKRRTTKFRMQLVIVETCSTFAYAVLKFAVRRRKTAFNFQKKNTLSSLANWVFWICFDWLVSVVRRLKAGTMNPP